MGSSFYVLGVLTFSVVGGKTESGVVWGVRFTYSAHATGDRHGHASLQHWSLRIDNSRQGVNRENYYTLYNSLSYAPKNAYIFLCLTKSVITCSSCFLVGRTSLDMAILPNKYPTVMTFSSNDNNISL